MDNSSKAAILYDKIAVSYAQEFGRPNEHLAEFLSMLPKSGKILDAGCGTGADADYMASRGFKVIGVDLSGEMVRLARKSYPGADFKIMDMRRLRFGPKSFSGILSAYSIIHLPKKDVPGMLKKFHGLLKPGGVLYVAVQEGQSREIMATEPFKPDEKMFLNIFSRPEITSLIEHAGFSIIKTHERMPINRDEFAFRKLYIIARKR